MHDHAGPRFGKYTFSGGEFAKEFTSGDRTFQSGSFCAGVGCQ